MDYVIYITGDITDNINQNVIKNAYKIIQIGTNTNDYNVFINIWVVSTRNLRTNDQQLIENLNANKM